jgi:N-acyl-L-homoserine lactone synthetase
MGKEIALSSGQYLQQILTQDNVKRIINNILNLPQSVKLRFGKVETKSDWRSVMAFRLKMYDTTVKYMLDELRPDGSDAYDSHSFIFAVWHEELVVGTIRLTPTPFETMQFLTPDQLNSFLGDHSEKSYLEWSRLLIDSSLKINTLLPAMTVYAGLNILATTQYEHYFGYTKPIIRKILSRFQIAEEKIRFSIPNRGDHSYFLLKGNFLNDFNHLVKTGLA